MAVRTEEIMKKVCFLAVLCLSFSAVATPPKMTFAEIETLASQGNAEAQARLGEAYLNGNYEQAVDFAKAFEWSQKAAMQGNARAALNLGVIYLNGYQGKWNYERAKTLFEQANQAGEVKAARYLGIIFERGLGVAQDFAQAAR